MNAALVRFEGDLRLALPAHVPRRVLLRAVPTRTANSGRDASRVPAGPLGLLAVLLLAAKGAAGVAGAAFVVLAATLAAVGTVPVESVALILGIHRLMSQALTPTNLIGNGVATLVIAKWERALDERQLQRRLARKDAEQT